jgi:ribosomal protein S12 methylthiotransferase
MPTVALVTLGCARNEVDSSELAGRLAHGGYHLLDEGSTDVRADVVVVNTCAFVAQAKKDSIDTLLAAADTGAKVVAVGCLAERYGAELAAALPEADAVLGFDAYADLPELLGDVMHGHRPAAHTPVDRRTLLPISPVARPAAAGRVSVPGHGSTGQGHIPPSGPVLTRRLLHAGPVAPLKIASGCDRRCSFCAIPSFRGAFVSRPADEIVAEAGWLAGQGVREIVLVSENSTSYGKDRPGDRPLEQLLVRLAAVTGIERVRLSYLQPAETRDSLIRAIADTPRVADYYDMSFQHASEPVLRRMRRFGSRPAFLDLVTRIRAAAPEAGIRSNVIVGFPGETERDAQELEQFLIGARLDAVGVFGYSDEDGTAAEQFDGKIDDDVIAERVERVTALADELATQRAEDRIGTRVIVLVDDLADGVVGRAEHQAPEVDGTTTLADADGMALGSMVVAEVVDTDGIDLIAVPRQVLIGPDSAAVSALVATAR